MIAPRADEALVADHDAFLDVRVLANVVGAADHRAAQPRRVPDVAVVVHDRALEVRVGLHDDVGAEHRVRREHGARLDAGVVADEHRALDDRVGRDVDALADPHALAQLEAGQLDAATWPSSRFSCAVRYDSSVPTSSQ